MHWKPVFDDQPAQSIGSIAIAPSDPNVVWVGTGETFIRSNVSLGNGIYKSTDAGKTWTHMGLEKTGRIGRVVVDPRNPDVVFAAALGTCYGPQQERGVYRTTDGGKTWERVLFVDENTGASDLAMDPTNPRILFAGTWQIDIKTWGRKSGGPGSGVFVSRDGGTTWKRITGHGLPEPPLGKIAVAVAPERPRSASTPSSRRGSAARSGARTTAARSGSVVNAEPPPERAAALLHADARHARQRQRGLLPLERHGRDLRRRRDRRADPLGRRQPRHVGRPEGPAPDDDRQRRRRHDLDDARPAVELRAPADRRRCTTSPTDNRIPYMRLRPDAGRRLDARARATARGGGGIPPALWTSTAGCETGWTTPDPVDPDIVWGGCYAGVVERFDAKTGMSRTRERLARADDGRQRRARSSSG